MINAFDTFKCSLLSVVLVAFAFGPAVVGCPIGDLDGNCEIGMLAVGYDPNEKQDDPNRFIQDNLMELLAVFSMQGHSGSSAPYCVNTFEKLALYKPLVPLTGEDNEWVEVIDGEMWQNNRCSHVFKDADGNAYDGEGRIFREPNGACYTSSDSRVPVTFPYTPKREYVDVPAEEEEARP